MNCSFAASLYPLNIVRVTKRTKKPWIPVDTITVSTARKHKYPLFRAFPKRSRVCSPSRNRFIVGHVIYPQILVILPGANNLIQLSMITGTNPGQGGKVRLVAQPDILFSSKYPRSRMSISDQAKLVASNFIQAFNAQDHQAIAKTLNYPHIRLARD